MALPLAGGRTDAERVVTRPDSRDTVGAFDFVKNLTEVVDITSDKTFLVETSAQDRNTLVTYWHWGGDTDPIRETADNEPMREVSAVLATLIAGQQAQIRPRHWEPSVPLWLKLATGWGPSHRIAHRASRVTQGVKIALKNMAAPIVRVVSLQMSEILSIPSSRNVLIRDI
jgi:hypothetical protein